MAEVTYYWDALYTCGNWAPCLSLADGLLTTFAATNLGGDQAGVESTTCPGTDLGTITKVELRVYGYGDGDDRIDLAFISDMSTEYQFTMPVSAGWSSYADVTNDPNVNGWTWAKVKDIYTEIAKALYIEFDKVGKANTMRCAMVEIRVTYTPSGPPTYPYHRRTLKGTGPYSGRRGFDEITGHRRGFWPAQ